MTYHTCLRITCDPAFTELLIAELADAGFESFAESESSLEAYADGEEYDKTLTQAVIEKYQSQTPLSFAFEKIEKQNWNEAWENSYDPIIVDDLCIIRAEFHKPDKSYPWELIITPKMSFGTGHHQTTYLMIRAQLKMDFNGKRVMDAGCGTSILAVMASRLGAREIEAFDIDEWSVSNSQDNIELNHCTNIHHQLGKLADLNFSGSFDIILANINKNVLLDEIPLYAGYLAPNGLLLLSGFFTEDIPDLMAVATKHGLSHVADDSKDNWASLLVKK